MSKQLTDQLREFAWMARATGRPELADLLEAAKAEIERLRAMILELIDIADMIAMQSDDVDELVARARELVEDKP